MQRTDYLKRLLLENRQAMSQLRAEMRSLRDALRKTRSEKRTRPAA